MPNQLNEEAVAIATGPASATVAIDNRNARINCLSLYLKRIEELAAQSQSTLWFRGVDDAAHSLMPSLFRGKGEFPFPPRIEEKISLYFKERAAPFLRENYGTYFEQMFLMQHYGVPTRLLDWSENPFVALFFALSTRKPDKDAAVWVLAPHLWNKRVFQEVDAGFTPSVVSLGNSLLRSYDLNDGRVNATMPAAICGIHNSPRIVAQRGVFTIFGGRNESMDAVHLRDLAFDRIALTKMLISADDALELMKGLMSNGYFDSVLYPDMEGFSKEVRRKFNFL